MLLKEKAEALREEAEEMICVPSLQPHITEGATEATFPAFHSQFETDLQNMDSQISTNSL